MHVAKRQRQWWAGVASAQIARCSFLLRQQSRFLADRRRDFLSELGEEPRKGHFQSHVIVRKIDQTGRALAKHADIESETVTGPGLLAYAKHRGIVSARICEPGFYAACRLLTTEMVRNGYDQRFRHGTVPVCPRSGLYGGRATQWKMQASPRRSAADPLRDWEKALRDRSRIGTLA